MEVISRQRKKDSNNSNGAFKIGKHQRFESIMLFSDFDVSSWQNSMN